MISRVRRRVFPGSNPVSRGENTDVLSDRNKREIKLSPKEYDTAASNEFPTKTDEHETDDEKEEAEESVADTTSLEHTSEDSKDLLNIEGDHDEKVGNKDLQSGTSHESARNGELASSRPPGRVRRLRQKMLDMKFVRNRRLSLLNSKIDTSGNHVVDENGSSMDNLLYSDANSGQSKISIPSDSTENPSPDSSLLQAPVIRQNASKKAITVSLLSLYKNSSRKVSLEQFPTDAQSSNLSTQTASQDSIQKQVHIATDAEEYREAPGDLAPSSNHQGRRSFFPRLIHLKSSDDILHLPVSAEQKSEVAISDNAKATESTTGRRRSRTVGTYDFTKSGRVQASSSSTNTRARSRHSNTSSPLATVFKIDHFSNSNSPPQNPRYTRFYSRSFSGKSPPVLNTSKSSSDQSVRQTLVIPDKPSQAYSSTSSFSTARRSNSIVNALSNFVTLRPSSSRSQQRFLINEQNYAKVDLDDLPTPPDPEENESYESYLEKLSVYGKFVGPILSSKDDKYKLECLENYLDNHFSFYRDPLDISLRKVLMFLELPKESQQIDRLLTRVSRVYYKQQKEYYGNYCPWVNENQVYFVLFSLLMLHTDFFNPNNKKKMTRPEFLSLVHEDTYSYGDKIPLDILAYYYDNILVKESPKFNFLTPFTPQSMSFSPFSTYSSETLSASANKLVHVRTSSSPTQQGFHRTYSDPAFTPPSSPKSPIGRSHSGMIPHQSIDPDDHMDRVSDKDIPKNKLSRVTRNTIYSPKEIIGKIRQESYSDNVSDDRINVCHYIEAHHCRPTTAAAARGRAASGSLSISLFSPTPTNPNTLTGVALSSNSMGNSLTSPLFSSSSSSNTSLRDDIDIYNQIFRDNLHNVSMHTQVSKLIPYNFTDKELMDSHPSDNKYGKYFRVLKEFKGAYLQVSRTQLNKLEISEYSIHNATNLPQQSQLLRTKQTRHYHIKIIQMGEVKELVGDQWKSKVVLLTPLGLFSHEVKQSSFNNLLPGMGSSGTSDILTTEFHRDDDRDESYFVVNFKSGFETVGIDGIFAEVGKNPQKPTSNDAAASVDADLTHNGSFLTIWDSNGKKFSWKLNNTSERNNWIDSINLMGSLYGTSIDSESLNDTAFPVKKMSVAERYQGLVVNNQKLIEEFNEFEKKLRLYGQCIPICFKTRNELMNCIKHHAVEENISVRKYKRNDIYMFIIRVLDSEFEYEFLRDVPLLTPVLTISPSQEGEREEANESEVEIEAEAENKGEMEVKKENQEIQKTVEITPSIDTNNTDSTAEFKSAAEYKEGRSGDNEARELRIAGDAFRFDEVSLVECVTEEETVQDTPFSHRDLSADLDTQKGYT